MEPFWWINHSLIVFLSPLCPLPLYFWPDVFAYGPNFINIQVDLVIHWLFYLHIRLFTLVKLVKKAKFLVKMCLFFCEFSIRGPKYQDVSTPKNKAHLYCIAGHIKLFWACFSFLDRIDVNFGYFSYINVS